MRSSFLRSQPPVSNANIVSYVSFSSFAVSGSTCFFYVRFEPKFLDHIRFSSVFVYSSATAASWMWRRRWAACLCMFLYTYTYTYICILALEINRQYKPQILSIRFFFCFRSQLCHLCQLNVEETLGSPEMPLYKLKPTDVRYIYIYTYMYKPTWTHKIVNMYICV